MLSLLKNILWNVILLYNNFIHWNLSKLLYYIYGIIVGVLLAIPFVILAGLCIWWSDMSIAIVTNFLLYGSGGVEFMWSLFSSPVISIIALVLLALAALALWLGISYGEYLLYGLNFGYLKWKKIKIFSKKRFYNIVLLKKYIALCAWVWASLLVPIVIYLMIIGAIVIGFWWIEPLNNYLILNPSNAVSISLLILFIIVIGLCVGLIYRLSFAFLLLIDSKASKTSALKYLKKSYILTSGWKKPFRFLIVLLLALLAFSPLLYIGDSLQNKQADMHTYSDFIVIEQEMGSDAFAQQLKTSNPQAYDLYSLLQLEYGSPSIEELSAASAKLNWYNNIYLLFYFLTLYGVMHMIFTSFYIHCLKK